jgi:hypothetical protein
MSVINFIETIGIHCFLLMVQIEGAVNLMKVAFDESLVWESNDVSPEIMKVLPVNFMTVTSQLYDSYQSTL